MEEQMNAEFSSEGNARRSLPFGAKLTILVLIGVAIFLLVRQHRGQFIAAVVNKTPIWRHTLNQELVQKYGQDQVNQMIQMELLEQAARSEGISVSAEAIQAERDNLKERLGGEENLMVALEQYGLTEDDLSEQLRLSLLQRQLQEKLFSVEVADDEVRIFFDDNGDSLYPDQSFDDVANEIREGLRQQKLQQEFSRWLEEQKSKAQIQIYI
jgi:hypothetical protein